MKKNNDRVTESVRPTEAEIREYAHELYIQSGWIPGRDLDNWLEAEAYLTRKVAEQHGHARVHAHESVPAVGT